VSEVTADGLFNDESATVVMGSTCLRLGAPDRLLQQLFPVLPARQWHAQT